MIRNDTDYALRMVVHLAEQSPRGVAASELSDRLGVPHSFAQKILRKLAAEEILQSKPGRRGGFNLNRQLGGVSLMDVIVAIQGPPLLNRCMGNIVACARQPSCRISASLQPFQDKLNTFLCRTSLSDILSGPARPQHFAQRPAYIATRSVAGRCGQAGSGAKTAHAPRRPGAGKQRPTLSDMGRAMR